ncbi:hypothetical protein NL108_011915 [Boleophthalmus pectinirostris]|nr:hypothetical protein NL108_011915 [Boleophthalmus pectinirostris]
MDDTTNCTATTSAEHDYVKIPDDKDMILGEEEFPHLPLSVEGTPCKEPAPKKALLATPGDDGKRGYGGDQDVTGILSNLINTRFDDLEKLINANTVSIEGLKKSVDFAFDQIKDVKQRVDVIESNTRKDGATILQLQERLVESERYSRRWNLKLYGVPETVIKEEVKKDTIRICQSVFPEGKQKLPDVIDIVHRLGKMRENENKPRGIILRFSSRTYRDAVWKAAKNSSFLKERHLYFTEDLCPADRERRAALWPVIQAARREGKIAYYVGPRAYISSKEVSLPGN